MPKYLPVSCLEIIKDYNSAMGGVDLLYQKTGAYKSDRKSSGGRYYLALFFDLIVLSIIQKGNRITRLQKCTD